VLHQYTKFEVRVPFIQRYDVHTFYLSINQPGDSDLETGVLYCLPTNFGVSETFCSRLMGQHLSVARCDFATLTFEVKALVSNTSCVPSLKFVGPPIRKI